MKFRSPEESVAWSLFFAAQCPRVSPAAKTVQKELAHAASAADLMLEEFRKRQGDPLAMLFNAGDAQPEELPPVAPSPPADETPAPAAKQTRRRKPAPQDPAPEATPAPEQEPS